MPESQLADSKNTSKTMADLVNSALQKQAFINEDFLKDRVKNAPITKYINPT